MESENMERAAKHLNVKLVSREQHGDMTIYVDENGLRHFVTKAPPGAFGATQARNQKGK